MQKEHTAYNPQTTDNQNELFRHVDENDNPIGSITRKEAHNETTYPRHRSTHIHLFDKQGRIYISQRSLTKDTWAGSRTIAAGWHVIYGDTYEDTAHREVEEELGHTVELVMIDKVFIEHGKEKEVIGVFAGLIDHEEPTFDFNKEEVAQVKGFHFHEFIAHLENNTLEIWDRAHHWIKHTLKTGTLHWYYDKHVKKHVEKAA